MAHAQSQVTPVRSVLVLLAHHDDEYFCTARLRREVAHGSAVHVAYTTYGSGYGTQPEVREAESRRVFLHIGIPEEQVREIGRELGVFDGHAVEHLQVLHDTVPQVYAGERFERIITLAWEGGHPDHDATHLIAVRLAADWGITAELHEIPTYTGEGAPGALFRVNWFRPGRSGRVPEGLGWRARFQAFLLARHYRSQWRSFLGLLPEAAIRMLLQGRQELRRVAPGEVDHRVPPHPGGLFYERRFGMRFERFLEHARPFLDHQV